MELKISTFDSESAFGYKQITTLFQDFSIAENFGSKAIEDTFIRVFKEYKNSWKTDYMYLTELVMVLNWKIWQWYGKNDELAQQYSEMWEMADMWACENLKGKALEYFYRTTD